MGFELDSLTTRARSAREGTVPGLMFRVTAEALQTHLKERSEHHKKRAEEKSAELPKLEQTVKNLEESIAAIKKHGKESEVPAISAKAAYNDTIGGALAPSSAYGFSGSEQVRQLEQQIEALRKDIRGHANKAASYQFLAGSLFNGVYCLDWQDLQQLELVK